MNQFTDQALWSLIQEDDRQAFALLFDRYFASLYSLAFHHIQDKNGASQVTQDLFVNLWERRGQLQIKEFNPYLHAALKYQTFKYQKDQKKAPVSFTERFQESPSETSLSEQKENAEDLEKRYQYHLAQLPKRCREIFILSRGEDFTIQEIANHFQISRRTVENQISHALHHLRLVLGRRK